MKDALIFLGGAIGTLARYHILNIFYHSSDTHFPTGTLLVNLLGSFIVGFFWFYSEFVDMSENLRVFIFVGLIASFTSFSTFILESLKLMQDGDVKIGVFKVLITPIVGVTLAFLGFMLAKMIFAPRL